MEKHPPLQLFRRHGGRCAAGHKADHYTSESEERRKGAKRCECPIFLSGTLGFVQGKKGTRQSDWNVARRFAAVIQSWDDPLPLLLERIDQPSPAEPAPAEDPAPRGGLLFEDAIRQFLADHKNAQSAELTIQKYGYVLKELKQFADRRGEVYVEDWDGKPALVRELLGVFGEKGITATTRSKKLSVLKTFFEFFLENRVIQVNPARIRDRRNRALRQAAAGGQKRPFTDAELETMLAACSRLGRSELREWPKKKEGRQVVAITEFKDYNRKFTGQDLADFINLSVHTGLRISDICLFDISRLTPTNEIKLRATKNGEWISIPIESWLAERLRTRARLYGPKVFRPTGVGLNAITNNWRRPLKDLWALCGAWSEKPTPHRFRHTFVRILLDQGLSIAMIAELAGDAEEMIRKHYAAWMPSRQQAINEALRAAFRRVPTGTGIEG